MDRIGAEQRWFWATLMLSSISIAGVVYAVWELLENRFFRDTDYVTLRYLYITRVGPGLKDWANYRNPVSWIQAMWNHAPAM